MVSKLWKASAAESLCRHQAPAWSGLGLARLSAASAPLITQFQNDSTFVLASAKPSPTFSAETRGF